MKLRDELGFLPLARHGSSLTGLFQTARALAGPHANGAIVLIDDFGEGLELDAALHLASILRQRAGQVWLSTRIGALGQVFRPEELLRLTAASDGARAAHPWQSATSRAERIAARHLRLQVLRSRLARDVLPGRRQGQGRRRHGRRPGHLLRITPRRQPLTASPKRDETFHFHSSSMHREADERS